MLLCWRVLPRPSKSSQWRKTLSKTSRGPLMMKILPPTSIITYRMQSRPLHRLPPVLAHRCICSHRHSHSRCRDQSDNHYNSHSNRLSLPRERSLQALMFDQLHPIIEAMLPHTIPTTSITLLIHDRIIQHHMVHQLCPYRHFQPLEATRCSPLLDRPVIQCRCRGLMAFHRRRS